MNPPLFSTLILSLSMSWLSSCSFFHKDPVVLQINTQKWTGRAFAKRLAGKIHTLNIQDIQNQALMEELKKQLITDLIMEHLIHQWARAHFLSVSEAELKQALQKIKKSYPSNEVFELHLKKRKIHSQEWENLIRNNLLNKKVMGKIGALAPPPSLKELKEYYKIHLSSFKSPARLLIYHIFHKKKEVLTKIKDDLKEEGSLIKSAKKLIKDPRITKAEWVEKGTLKIFDQAFSLKKDEISPVWSSAYAYHIIQVLDKKPSRQLEFEQVQQQIRRELLAQRQKALFIKWLDEQSKKLTVLKNETAIKKIKVKLL